MTTSISAQKKATETTVAPSGILLRTPNLNQEVDAHSADLVTRHAKKLHQNGFPQSAKTLVIKFAEGSLDASVPIQVAAEG